MRIFRGTAGVCATVGVALVVASCGSSGGGTSANPSPAASAAPTVSADASVVSQVPAKIKSKGTLVVATDPSYAPNEFLDTNGTTVVGMDADLAKALGTVMGLKVEVQKATFDGIIPGLVSGKYDLGMSSFTDTKEREKSVDFVTYFSAGTTFFTKSSGGVSLSGLTDLCGKSVAVESGTTQADDAKAQDVSCKKEGKAGVTVQTFADQNGANLAVSSGRAQLSMGDSPVGDYQVKQSKGAFKTTGVVYGTAPYGIAVPKDSGLSKPLLAAMQQLIGTGAYQKILANWGISDGAINNPAINAAES